VTLDWMLHVPFLAVMMVVTYVFSMFHKETAMKENNAWRDQGPVLCNKLAAALLFFVNVGLPLLFSVLKPWAFTSLALISFLV